MVTNGDSNNKTTYNTAQVEKNFVDDFACSHWKWSEEVKG